MENNNDGKLNEKISETNINNGPITNDMDAGKEIQGDNFVMRETEDTKSEYVGQSYNVNVPVNENAYVKKFGTYDEINKAAANDVPKEHPKKKKKGFFNKRALSYILVGIICATLGGVASGVGSLLILPNTELFKNTALYQVLSDQISSNISKNEIQPTTLASETEALTVAAIAKKVGPAVVGVSTTSKSAAGPFGTGVNEGMGSGIIINEEGYVLTNYHVVQGAETVKVIFNNGKEVAAKVMNYDADSDVAIVKITDTVKVPGVAELGDSKSIQVGESVVAIGNPLGKEFLGSVTTGVVSAVNRKLGNEKIDYIQTDAAINEGNSGGPLVNARGQVIGINTAKIGQSGVEGLGFSIPIDAVKDKIPNLSKPILTIGIKAIDVNDATAKKYQLVVGVYIQETVEFSPAEKAGIKSGDVITKFDGQKIQTVSEINKIKATHKNGDIVKIEINRSGKAMELELKLTE